MYGAGVNFARDASYSMHYATRPSTGPHRVMYLARVLVGRYCLGKKGILKPPPVNPEFPEIVFDSTVDNLANPFNHCRVSRQSVLSRISNHFSKNRIKIRKNSTRSC